jgi:hypothetical protein
MRAPHIQVRGPKHPRTEDSSVKVSLTLRFKDLSPEREAKLLDGLVAAITAVMEPAERAEFLRQYNSEWIRWERLERTA